MSSLSVRGVAASGWTPAASVLLLVAGLWTATDVAFADMLAFLGYVALAIVLPGVLCWRWLRPADERPFLEDVVFGAILGYAIELPVYLGARAVGVPLLVLAWPAVVIALALVTPGGRALWRPSNTYALPPAWSWTMAAILGYLFLWIGRGVWWPAPLSVDSLSNPGVDAAFHVALVSELRHHAVPQIPWLAGEPLHYHWLFHAHGAAASWVTGIDPVVLLRRFTIAPMLVLVVLGVALLAMRLSGRRSAGVVAAGILVLVQGVSVYRWADSETSLDERFMSLSLWGSPTLTFSIMVFLGTAMVIFQVLSGDTRWRTWVALLLLLIVTGGAKPSYLPMAVAGMLLVVAIAAVRGRVTREMVTVCLLVPAVFVAMQVWFYAGTDADSEITPVGTVKRIGSDFGLTHSAGASIGHFAVLGVMLLAIWTMNAAGLFGLSAERGWLDVRVQFVVGAAVAGVVAMFLLSHTGFSQRFFLHSAQPLIAIGAAVGFSRLVPPERTRELSTIVTAGLAIGAAILAGMSSFTSTQMPHTEDMSAGRVVWLLAAPIGAAVLLVFVVALVLRSLPSKVPPPKGFAAVFVVAALTGFGVFHTVKSLTVIGELPWPSSSQAEADEAVIGPGGIASAYWIRDNTPTDDLVAINAHVRTPDSADLRAFWLAAYAERRVLVQGWGYTEKASRGIEIDEVPFWDQEKLAANDRAFTRPSPETLAVLRDEYGVSWLVADLRFPVDREGLDQVAEAAYEEGDYVVYDLRSLRVS